MSSDLTPRPVIRVAPIETLSIYQITEDELKELESGSPASLYLNFALALIPTGLSFLVTLLTTSITSERLFTVLVVVTVISLLVGVLVLVIWLRQHRSGKGLGKKIRRRMPPPLATQELTVVMVAEHGRS